MRRPLVAANWKMHGNKLANKALLEAVTNALNTRVEADVVIAAPHVYLEQVGQYCADSDLQLAAQNVSEFEEGAYTGEVSAEMLADLNCAFVIVGHSERRQYFLESDEQIASKFMRLQRVGICPILCVGESLQEREAGLTEKVVSQQLKAVIEKAGIKSFGNAVLAYEPVWAIGTGETASPEQAQAVHKVLRDCLASFDKEIASQLRIIYGGSVNESNAAELFNQTDIDGGLIGGASLNAESFLTICKVI